MPLYPDSHIEFLESSRNLYHSTIWSLTTQLFLSTSPLFVREHTVLLTDFSDDLLHDQKYFHWSWVHWWWYALLRRMTSLALATSLNLFPWWTSWYSDTYLERNQCNFLTLNFEGNRFFYQKIILKKSAQQPILTSHQFILLNLQLQFTFRWFVQHTYKYFKLIRKNIFKINSIMS